MRLSLALPRPEQYDGVLRCDRCNGGGAVLFPDGCQLHLACDAEMRAEATEEAALAEPPSRLVYVPGNERIAMALHTGAGGEA